jgi:hypothetical protein
VIDNNNIYPLLEDKGEITINNGKNIDHQAQRSTTISKLAI